MATVLAYSDRSQRSAPKAKPVAVAAAAGWERSAYQASGGSKPIAALASMSVVAAMLAAFVIGHVPPAPRPAQRLVVMDVKTLPPPPPKAQPIQRKAAPPPLYAPPVLVETPAPVTIATAPVPAPPAPAAPVIPAPPAPAADPHPVAAAGPLDKGDLSSKMLEAKPPAYPVESRRLHEQGAVRLAVLIDAGGHVADVSVATSSGSDRLDRAALGAVRHWRWAPTIQAGIAVMVRGYVIIPFVLRS